jgi:tetratricopeptide (TPR) repeat protein
VPFYDDDDDRIVVESLSSAGSLTLNLSHRGSRRARPSAWHSGAAIRAFCGGLLPDYNLCGDTRSLMALNVSLPLAFGRFKQLPQRTGEIWQGGVVRLPAWVDHPTNPEGEPFRPTAALWVSLRTGLIHLALPPKGSTVTPDFVLSTLLEFGLKYSKGLEGRPARIEVRDAALRDALADALAKLSTSVAVVADMTAVREVLNNLEAEATGGRRFLGVLESPGVTPDRLRAFAEAAASFYSARVWDHLANEDLIVVDGDATPRAMRHISVLGQGGQQFGVCFFDSREAFERVLDLADARYTSRAHGVTFGPIHELPFADADAWLDHALPVAGARAYPLAADLRRDGSVRRPAARELTYSEALLRALAETSEDELDAARWHKRVHTFDGSIELTLTLPLLLEAEAGHGAIAPRLAAMPRVAERSSVRIARLAEGRSFESMNDLNAEIDRAGERGLFDLPAEAAAGRELTPLERAQELAYDAMEAAGRLQIKRARQALAVSPDCADAWVILAESASTQDLALDRYEQGVAAGVRAIGADRFEKLRGEFWGHLDTRPYMRARLGLAQILRGLDRHEEALAHYRELLRLNPNDNQGVRYLFVAALLELNQNAEAGTLLDEHSDDIQALWPYARVLWLFRTDGDSPRTSAALDEARRINPHVVKYLVNPDSLPFDRPAHYALGSKDEAAYVAEELCQAYSTTAGATSWLRSQTRKRRK